MDENVMRNMESVVNDLTDAKTAIQNAYDELKKSYTGSNAKKQYTKCEEILASIDNVISLVKT